MFIEPYLANVTIFAGNFAPRSWMFCRGQLLSINEYTALYALIGTTYGGDGQNTFALPNLQGRIAVHPNTSTIVLGQIAGTESISLVSAQLPPHNHVQISFTGTPPSASVTGNSNTPVNSVPAMPAANIYNSSADGFGMAESITNTTTPLAGGSSPVPIISPILAMNYIIAVEGIFPSRN